MDVSWFDQALELHRQTESARKLHQQFKDRLNDGQVELAALDIRLTGARIVIDHHKQRQRGFDFHKYRLHDGSDISVEDMQELRRRADELRRKLSEWEQGRSDCETIWQQCAQRLRDLVFTAILKSPVLTDEQQKELQDEAGRSDVDIQIHRAEQEVHVYLGNPNRDPHGHIVVEVTDDLVRLCYLRFRTMLRIEALYFPALRGMARVRAKCSHPSFTNLFFNKPAALVLPQVGVNTFLFQ